MGIGTEYADEVDFLCPFLSVNREDDSPLDVPGALRDLAVLKRRADAKPVIPLLKTCWELSTNNTTEDVSRMIQGCEQTNAGYILWYYSWLFHSREKRYDPKTLLTAMGGDWQRMSRYLTPATGRPDAQATPSARAGATAVPALAFPHPETQVEKLPWPHQPPGLDNDAIAKLNREVWVINDFPLYQADEPGTWRYFHGGFDIVLENGTRIYAIKDGWVKAIRHSSIFIADAKGDAPSYGWEYTHLGNLQVKVGDFVKLGSRIGQVNFSGLPHIHLAKVFSQAPHWGRWHYLCPPNAHFTYQDDDPPVVRKPFYFFRNNSDRMIEPDAAGRVTVSGQVDIVVGMRDAGRYARSSESGFGDRLGVARIEYTISRASSPQGSKHQFHSFDFTKLRIKSGYDAKEYSTRLARVVYKHWTLFETSRPHGSQTLSYYTVTNCTGQEPPVELKAEDEDCCWNTAALTKERSRIFPDGDYDIAVIAHDFAGNKAIEVMRVTVANRDRE